MKLTEHGDQADELRKLLIEVQQNDDLPTEQKSTTTEQANHREIDILNLPPRKEVHSGKKRTKLKISKPFKRLLVVMILLILLLAGAIYIWGAEWLEIINISLP